ncbi:MAG: alpha/beta hydrolase [Armatimonadota bacterium]|nr:alpha/beta hydrolase [Armatimonadota bacterium]
MRSCHGALATPGRRIIGISAVVALGGILATCVAQPQPGGQREPPRDRRAQLVDAGDAPPAESASGPTVSFMGDWWEMRDVEYGVVDGHRLLLDAYLPADNQVHPAIVFIHGGGWRRGSKKGGFNAVQGPRAIADGIAVFSLDYRLSSVAPYPAAVEDCLRAIRWIRKHGGEFNVDPDALGLWGGSAGGHLVLMMAFMEPGAEDLDAGGNQLANFAQCVVAKNPPTDLTADDSMHQQRALLAFMDTTLDEAPARFAQASPVTHISPDDPPVLVMHGTEDRTVPYSQAQILAQRLEEAGVPLELITIEGGGHGLKGGDPREIRQAHERAYQFVRAHLLGE